MKLLLDTHFLLWAVLGLPRMDEFPWLDRYLPWGVSPTLPLAWTRDPFDRLLAAHSSARRTPLCTLDRRMRSEHRWVVPELAQGARLTSAAPRRCHTLPLTSPRHPKRRRCP